MGAGMVGNYIGTVLASLFLPLVWLIVARLVPPLRRSPGVANAVAVALAWFAAFASARGAGSAGPAIVAAVMAAALFYWNYRRDVRALADAQSRAPSSA